MYTIMVIDDDEAIGDMEQEFLHYMDNIDEKSVWTMDSTIFIYSLFVPLMVSLLTALFIGSDYSDGTMRNKLIAGQVRRNIYAANLVVNI